MKLGYRVLANLLSQGYVAVVALVVLPVYLNYLGGEAFGLVALSFTLQAWFVILDLGLTQILTRAAAVYRAGEMAPAIFSLQLRIALRRFFAIGAVALVIMVLWIFSFSSDWLHHVVLSTHDLHAALLVMSLLLVLRWFSELLRSVHAGFERFIWLSKFNAVIATLRFLAVVPLLVWNIVGIVGFFCFQLAVTLVECAILAHTTHRIVPQAFEGRPIGLQSNPDTHRFVLSMALASVCWVLVSQTDKLMLSGLTSLADFGSFTLATSAAGAVLLATNPLSAVVVPRMTALLAQGDCVSFKRIYRDSTQWTGIIAWPIAAILTLHAEHVMFVWTGNRSLAASAAPVLQLYASGNACVAVSAVAYAGQFARGDLRLHVLGSVFFLFLLLPLVIGTTSVYGPIGAGWVWLLLNLAFMLLWLKFPHRLLGPYPHSRWLMRDVIPLSAIAFVTVTVGLLLPWPEHRLWLGVQLVLFGIVTGGVTLLGASSARAYFENR